MINRFIIRSKPNILKKEKWIKSISKRYKINRLFLLKPLSKVQFVSNIQNNQSQFNNETDNISKSSTKQKSNHPPTIGSLDIRVGKIIEISRHPDADKLYVEKIDVGEDVPRTIVSGLVDYIPIYELHKRLVLVVCNLPERKMRGITSEGMVLASSVVDGEQIKVSLIDPPSGSKVGERLQFNVEDQIDPKISSKKLEKIMKKCKVNEDGVAVFINDDNHEIHFKTSNGVCTSSLKNSQIS